MKRKIKEKLIKWSRSEAVYKLKYFELFIALAMIVSFIPVVLYDIGAVIFLEKTYNILNTIFIIVLGIGVMVITITEILNTIESKYNDGENLLYVLGSNRKVTECIIWFLFYIALLIPFAKLRLICYLLFMVLYIILPKKIENYFKEKLR